MTIFLLKDSFREPEQIFNRSEELTELPLARNAVDLGSLFIQPSNDRLPAWVSLFSGMLRLDLNMVRNASTAAVWILDVENSKFAITFGYGRNLLRASCYEEDFGLRVTLNSVDPNKIKAIDRMTLDSVAQQTRIQASQEATMSEFGLDVEQDLLRAVTGVPADASLGQRFTGRDALQVTIPITLDQIPQLLMRFLEEFAKQDYKIRFPWIEQIHEIDDAIKRAELDILLIQKLRLGNLDGVWLAVPELIDWDGLAGFRYRGARNARVYSDIHAQAFLEEVGNAADIDEHSLKKRYHVSAIANDTDAIVKQWPVYRCFYCEVASGDDTFLLNNGRWFRISSSFVQRINESVDKIPENTILLRPYEDKSEAAYSKRASDLNVDFLALMDMKLIGAPTLPNKVEFCDLYSRDKQIVHIKRYSSSSALSHLFAQGVVSARLFQNEPEFRRQVNALLPESHRIPAPDSNPRPQDFEVIFGIISRSKKKLILPFFSRVNLKNAHSNLTGMGFKVSLCKIPSL